MLSPSELRYDIQMLWGVFGSYFRFTLKRKYVLLLPQIVSFGTFPSKTLNVPSGTRRTYDLDAVTEGVPSSHGVSGRCSDLLKYRPTLIDCFSSLGGKLALEV